MPGSLNRKCILFLAVALTLIGGVQHVDSSGTRVRGESHLLLVGDPGQSSHSPMLLQVLKSPTSYLSDALLWSRLAVMGIEVF